jgi:hypothetical protein
MSPKRSIHNPITIAVSLLLSIGLLAGCSIATTATGSDTTTSAAAAVEVDATQSAEQVLAANDAVTDSSGDVDESAAVDIALDGDTATSSGDGVTVDGSTVTITAAGTYRISGTLDDGQVIVDTADTGTVALVLDGASLSSSMSAAIDIRQAESAVVSLAAGTENAVSDTSSYDDSAEANAAPT